jgi:cytochrome c biogenesis protein CcmG, thiol:disulfide interchange protein DsbE
MASGFPASRSSLPWHGLLCLLACFCADAVYAGDWKTYSGADGQPPPPLVLTDMNGAEVNLAALKGKVVLVNFWATWCEPCRDEMPSLDQLQQRLGQQDFKVLAVNIGEGKARIQQFLTAVPVDFTIVRDTNSAAMKAWQVRILPSSFLIDQKGSLRYQLVGEANWNNAAAQAPILELLNRSKSSVRLHSAAAGK